MNGGLFLLFIIVIWRLGRQSEPSTAKLRLMNSKRLPEDIAIIVKKKKHDGIMETKVFRDKVLICSECKQEFVFTSEAQEYFLEKGISDEPKRCKSCYFRRKGGRGGGLAGVPH